MSRKTTAWKPSEWYRKAVAADRAREARQFTTAPKARTPEANAKAVAYAEWLAQRDGVSLEALAGPARDHFNETKAARTIQTGRGMSRHTNGPARIPDEWRIKGRVRWEPTQHGYRPQHLTAA